MAAFFTSATARGCFSILVSHLFSSPYDPNGSFPACLLPSGKQEKVRAANGQNLISPPQSLFLYVLQPTSCSSTLSSIDGAFALYFGLGTEKELTVGWLAQAAAAG